MQKTPAVSSLWRHYVNRRNAARIKAYLLKSRLFLRWAVRSLWEFAPPRGDEGRPLFYGEESSDKVSVVFINLDHRLDRLQETTDELAKLGIADAKRIRGIKRKNGHLGASLSHAKALRECKRMNSSLSIVLEDDAEFLCDRKGFFDLLKKFNDNPALDVLLLGNNPWTRALPVSRSFSLTDDSSSAGGYVIKRHAVDRILRSHQTSALKLAEGESPNTAALDQEWKKLQRNGLIFCVPRKLVFIQRDSYSDIQLTDHSWKVRDTQGKRER